MTSYAKKRVTVQDTYGNAIANASVRVLRESDSGLQTLYADRTGLDTSVGNPCYTGSNGMVEFYAPGGAYKFIIIMPGGTITERYEAIGTAAEFDSSAFQPVALTSQIVISTGTTTINDTTDKVVVNLGSTGNVTLQLGTVANRGGRPLRVTQWNLNATITVAADAGDAGGIKGSPSIDLVPGVPVEFSPITSLNGWDF